MDPKHLFYLSEIIRYGSLSRASERLGVVQPTLTRVVKVLEDQAGSPLMTRGRYGVSPTELGAKLAKKGSDIGQMLSEASEAVDLWKSGLGQELQVGVGPMLALSIFPQFLEHFLSKRWQFNLKITTATAGRLVDRLNVGELDLALAPSRLNLHQEKLVQEVVFEDEMAFYVGRKSPLVGLNRIVTPAELSEQHWIAVGARSNIYEEQRDLFDMLGMAPVLPRISFTGDINMCLSLLETTGVLVTLPRRLTEISGRLRPEQRIEVGMAPLTRNVAFWTTKENIHRPQVLQFRKTFTKWLDQTLPSPSRT